MLKQPDEALVNAEKSLEIARKVSNKRVEARSCVVQGMIYLELNDIQKAQRFLEQGTPIARNLKFPEEHLLALEHSYKLYEKIKNYEKAYLFLKAFKAHSDSVVNDVNYKIILQREYEYNEQQRKLKNEYNEQQRKIERRNEIWIRYSLIAGVLLAFGLVFFAYRAFMVKSKAFRIISQQQEELQVMNEELIQNQEEIITQRNFIEEQNANLSSKNEQITQSITTALAIQKALLPFDNRVKQFLKEYFVLYQPRDIVSGDFYWIERVENKAVIVAADCTGHGVPGAFMSLVAINLLERVVLQQEITVPSLILHELHDLVRIALKQDEIENQSGMDLAVVMLDLPEENYTEVTLHFAGAKRPLHYIDALNPTKVGKIAGSRRAIGGFQNETISFEETSLTLPKGSTFYISSDGLADQNNKQRKRLTDAPILEVLLAHYPSLPTQHEAIQAILNAQMEGTTQRDDILFLGIKC
jgi:serine phosphatase RsbU (regulator of sigma subunit)